MRIRGRFRWAVVIAAIFGLLASMGFTSAAVASSPPASSRIVVDVSAYGKPTPEEIRALFGEWNQALATLDANKVADRYAPDAVLVPTMSNDVRTDRAEIVDYFEHFLQGKPRGTILESHVEVLGQRTAVDTGVYRFTLIKDGVTKDVDARYTFVYERIGGKWYIQNHHSSAMPEQG
jgi:uncharacterized protein (TIGR02246 family)